MIKVILPDGAVKEVSKGTTPFEVAQSISEGLARNVISASYNQKTIETSTSLETDGMLTLYTWNDDEGKKAFGTQVLTYLLRPSNNYTQGLT